MPTSKQRREAAQRHLQRQLERRAEQARRRRRNALVGVAVLAVAGRRRGHRVRDRRSARAARRPRRPRQTLCLRRRSGDHQPPTARSAAPTPRTPAATPTSRTSARRRTRQVTPTKGTDTLKMATNQGDLTLTLNRSSAPCAAASFTYLASKKFFDNSPCHREVNEADLRRPAVRRPDRHRLRRPELHLPPGGHVEDDLPARHDRHGQHRAARTRPAASSSSASPTPSSRRTTPPSARSTRPASPCWTRSRRPATTARSTPSAGGGAPNTPVTITSMTVAELRPDPRRALRREPARRGPAAESRR